ncbi:hypothetical protein [Herminiimonas sp. CN]|nr:hypothetical protein [Herminiimonas sp. CN]
MTPKAAAPDGATLCTSALQGLWLILRPAEKRGNARHQKKKHFIA